MPAWMAKRTKPLRAERYTPSLSRVAPWNTPAIPSGRQPKDPLASKLSVTPLSANTSASTQFLKFYIAAFQLHKCHAKSGR